MLRRCQPEESGVGERGQALVEFIILLPIVMMFVWYLVHVNLAINKSIVGQKHARSQLFLKLFNHRSGPVASDITTKRSHFYIGVSAKPIGEGDTGVRPIAPVETIGVGMSPRPNASASDDPGEPPPGTLRQRVRVRTVFGICTHRKKSVTGNLADFCSIERN